MAKNKNQSLLWKISGGNSKKTSYVFGTIHVRDSRAFFNNKTLLKKIAACDSYVGEFNLEDTDPMVLSKYMLLPNGKTISEQLSIKQAKALDKLLNKQIGIGLEQLNHHKPLLVINLLTESFFEADMPEPLDSHLFNYAKVLNKRMDGLETFEEQLNVLVELSLKSQFKSLISTVKKFKNFKQQLKKLTQYYMRQDIQKLYQTAKRNSKGMRKILIYKRNKIMANRIDELVRKESAFIAVGAGHLAGEKGILRLLKKQGYKVTPVRFGR